ncbi:hypothetical protein QBC46DRAFT_400895 [Diplogelasinospora grovesii]|uniref:Protein kinase domain-containing protein n=1 Tax=Diplogelasinospora grovesii TaxID=303347 RepID=A0AAN6MW53_9PEZI|nr:hypothetical protein QBC46DRAFT_400895 [Diplogelasinospora grovesii]
MEDRVKELEQELLQARQRVKEQEERARKAEKERNEEKERVAQLSKELERSKQLQEQTTLDQYLTYCHLLLFQPLKVELVNNSKGNTKVDGKFYPLSLRPWEGFVETQQRHFDIIKDALRDEKIFSSWTEIRGIQRHAHGSPVANEDDIKPFVQLAVEGPVKEIFSALSRRVNTSQTLQPFNFSRLSFTNHAYSVSQHSESGPSDRGGKQRRSSPTKRIASGEKAIINPDRRCIREDLNGDRTIAFVFEYKAAHKIQVEDLRQSLGKEDLFTEVIRRVASTKSSNDPDQNMQEKTDRLAAMFLTQMFDYMIQLGLEYGYLTAGKYFVFLHIKGDDLRTLYYALVGPNEEADGDNTAVGGFETAVAQVASFCLLTFQSTPHMDAWVPLAQDSLCQWPISYPEMDITHETEHETEEEPIKSSQSSELSFPLPSTVPLREHRLRSRSTCKDPETDHNSRREDTDDDDTDDDLMSRDSLRGALPLGRSQPQNKRKQAPPSSGDSSGGALSETEQQTRLAEQQTYQYCTQACLLGLKRGWKLDENCPNVSSHRTVAGGTQHPITASDLTCLIQEQLQRYRDCEPLEKYGKHGARGTLFKLSLSLYRYTFVGKGTVSENVRYLLHEADVYRRLKALQGKAVPVFLGNIDLVTPYNLTARHAYYFAGAKIAHMLLMSWVGEETRKSSVLDLDMAAEVAQLSQAVRREGVVHNDERAANALWSEERRRVMLIDFDRAVLLPLVKHKQLQELSSKRRRRENDSGAYRRKAYLGNSV